MRARWGRLGLVAACALAAGAFAAPANAGSGPSHTVPLMPVAPTINGAFAFGEWDAADSFSVSFGSLPGTVYVGRDATYLYLGIVVGDATGAVGDSAFFFDNNDNGVVDHGENVIFLNHGGSPQDYYALDSAFSQIASDVLDGGTNDVTAATANPGEVTTVEYKVPLCSADTAHDFCFSPPATESSPDSRLGFTVSYFNASNTAGGYDPVGSSDIAHYANLVIPPPDTTPPTVSLDAPQTAYVKRGVEFVATAADTGSGVDHVAFEYATQNSGPWTELGRATSPGSDGKWHATWDTTPPDGHYFVRARAVDRLGNEATTSPLEITLDTTGPAISMECVANGSSAPSACKWFTSSAQLPVVVHATVADGATLGVVKYTTDGSDPKTSGTAQTFPGSGSYTESGTFWIYAEDALGNASSMKVDVGIDLTAPPAPHVLVQPAPGDFPTSHGTDTGVGVTAWYNPALGSSLTLSVPLQDDPQSGIASVDFGTLDASGWTALPQTAPNERSYSWTAGAAPPPSIVVASTNGAGMTGPTSSVAFSPDSTAPTGSISCVPAGCVNPFGPVHVTLHADDGGESGVNVLHYTTDGSVASSTNGVPAQSGNSFDVTTANTSISLWGIDSVGNAAVLATASVSGAPLTGTAYHVVPTAGDPPFATGFYLKAGFPVTISATGSVNCGGGTCDAGPQGFPTGAGPGALLPGAPGLGLLARTGTSGPWTYVGAGPTQFSGSGQLYFAVNDDVFYDNYGPGFDVTVAHGPTAPAGVLQNGGFESPLLAPYRGGVTGSSFAVPLAPGNWLPYSQVNNPNPAGQSTTQVLAGNFSGHIASAVTGGGGSELWQDAPATFAPNQGYVLDAWVYPVAGQSQVLMLFDTDRDTGASSRVDGITIDPGYTSFGAWGHSATTPALSYNTWHEVRLEADAGTFTSTFSVDGVQVGAITTPGTPIALNPSFALAQTAVMLGDDNGNGAVDSQAYYDDVSLQQLTAPVDPPQNGPTFTVNTDADHNDSTGCTLADCTLREAITAANAYGGSATVAFAIPGLTPTIQLQSSLPAISSGVTVDARTQLGAIGPAVVLDGRAVEGNGLTLNGDNVVVAGFDVQGFLGVGILVLGSHDQVLDNYSGLDVSGFERVRNGGDGIRAVNGDSNTIAGNAVGGNGGHGIFLIDQTNAIVQSNRSGTNASGTQAIGNGVDGIAVDGGSNNTIGGTEDRGNLSAGNANQGISLFGGFNTNTPTTHGNVVYGNTVGVGNDGSAIPNGGDGIRVYSGHGNVIGGTANGQGNVVANNHGAGVAVYLAGDTGNEIRGNSIYDNRGLGIDLNGDGVTANDLGDGDSGPNDLQNYPVFDPPVYSDGTVTITGSLNGLPNEPYAIDAYANTACDASGYGEGQTQVGGTHVATDTAGNATFTITFTAETAPAGIALTATDAELHQTSEFSQCQAPVEGRTTDSTVTLSSNVSSAEAGASVLDFSALDRSAYLPAPPPAAPIASSPIASSPIASSPIASSPIASSPIASSPIASSPIASSPIASSPIASSGFTSTNLQQNALGGVPLSQLALKPPLTWSAVLGQPVVEQAMTFAQALALSPRPAGLASLQVGDVDWARSGTALASLGVGAFVFGPVKLSDIAIDGATTPDAAKAAWCKEIDNLKGYQCSNAASLTDTTVMTLSLAGAPIASSGVDSAPIASSNLSDSPIASSPIASSTLQGTPIASSQLSGVDLAVSPFGAIPLSAVLATDSPLRQIPAASVLGCGAACPGNLGNAFDVLHLVPAGMLVRDLGSALDGYTIGDLKTYPGVTVGNIGRGLPSSLTLHDLFAALFPHIPFNPDTMPLDGVQSIADAGGVVTYSADFTLTGVGTTTAQLVATIAPGATYVLGSAKLVTNGVAAPYGDPGVVDGNVVWQLNGLKHLPTTYTLTFELRPSLQLGIDTTTVKLVPLGATAKTSDPVPVTVTDTFESGGGNNTPATATPIQPGKAYLSFEQTQADTDWYRLPVPVPGTTTTFSLSHLSHDQDLVVYAPAPQPLRSSPIASSPIASSPIASSPTPDTPATLQQATSALQPVAVQDIPIASSQLASSTIAGISDNTGTSSESVSVVATGAQQGGFYLVHVVDSAPTPSSLPYMLRSESQAPSPLPPCTPRAPFPNQGQGVAGALPGFASVPATVKTIVLVDYKRYGDAFGAGALSTLKSELATFVARPEVAGVVLPVDGSPAVQAAYDGWDASPCAPENANNVVRAIIANVVDPFRATHANVKFLTIVGGEDQIPQPRIADNTIQANETSYRDTLMNGAQVNNELVGTAASGYMLTDDVWSAFNPTPFLGGQLYLPQWATGRLVESPAQIDHQLTTYNTTGGLIAPTTQLSVGYGFLADSAAAVQNALNPFAAGGPGSLIGDGWSHADLLAKLQLGQPSPAIVAINTHFDHHRALPANGNVNDLFTSTDLNGSPTVAQNTAELSRLIFSIGCHSALSVPDSLYSWPFSLDWAEADMSAGAVARVGNTTFGYGDTDVIGYSEQIEVDFAQRLSQMTLGEALLYAKQQYFADLGVFGPYEQKATNALTFYGLPMQRIGAPPVQLPAPVQPTITDPATGLTALPIDSQVTFGAPVTVGDAEYFNGPSGVDATNNRPFEPKRIVPDITQPGTFPHGFLITDLGIDAQYAHVKIARSVAVPDSPGLTPPLSSQVGYPSNLARVSGFASPTGPRQQLVLTHGQFLSDTDSDTTGLGTQTNFNAIKGLVLYSSSPDAFPPQLSGPRVTRVGDTLGISVDATDTVDTNGTPGTVKEVVVVYYEPGSHTSHTAYLTQTPGTNHWSGAGPLTSPSTQEVNYFMQAVDANANVGIAVHKVAAAPVTLTQQQSGGGGTGGGTISFSVSGPLAGGGWYSGDASVAISAPAGDAISYSVDGAALRPYTGPVTVSGDGLHLVDATAEAADGTLLTAEKAIPIDVKAPSASITTPHDGAILFIGDKYTASFTCADGGSGIAASGGCTGTLAQGAAIPTLRLPGDFTFTVNAKDVVGNTGTASSTYALVPWLGFLPPVLGGPFVNTMKAGQAVPVPFSLARNLGLGIFDPGYPTSRQIACPTTGQTHEVERTVSATASSLAYDTRTTLYTYTWKTDAAWAGTCRELSFKLRYGSVRSAVFKFSAPSRSDK